MTEDEELLEAYDRYLADSIKPNQSLSDAVFESIDPQYRRYVASQPYYSFTPEQVEKFLTDPSFWVRWAITCRKDFVPTPEQLERGLKDPNDVVRESFEEINKR